MGSPCVPGIDQSINIPVEREQSIHTQVSTTELAPKTLKSNAEKNTLKSNHLANEDRWIDRPELPEDFGTLSRNSKSNVDR